MASVTSTLPGGRSNVKYTSDLINDGEFPNSGGKYVEDINLPDFVENIIIADGLGDKNTVIPVTPDSDTWDKIHDLNKVCAITTTDINGDEIIGQVLINDGVRVKIKFNSPQRGELILN